MGDTIQLATMRKQNSHLGHETLISCLYCLHHTKSDRQLPSRQVAPVVLPRLRLSTAASANPTREKSGQGSQGATEADAHESSPIRVERIAFCGNRRVTIISHACKPDRVYLDLDRPNSRNDQGHISCAPINSQEKSQTGEGWRSTLR